MLQGGSRVMAFDEHHAVLVVSKQSTNQLYPGFGIAKVNIYIYSKVTKFKFPPGGLKILLGCVT